MIKVIIKQQDEEVLGLQIRGHANYAEHGKDLVCAGVSSIAVGLLNALSQLCEESCTCSMSEGNIGVEILQVNQINQLILRTGIIQLQTMELSYKNYIKITKTEV